MPFTTAQRLFQLSVPQGLAQELGAQVDSRVFNIYRLIEVGMDPSLAKVVTTSPFVRVKATNLGLVPAVAAFLDSILSFDLSAIALFNRFTDQPNLARKSAINALIVSLKSGGVWGKLDALYVMAAADNQAARRNWIADQYNLTAVAAPTFTADRGYQGDGASSSLETSFNASVAVSPKFVQDSASISSWSRTDLTTDRDDMGNSNSLIRSRSAGGSLGARLNTATTIGSGVVLTSVGHSLARRSDAANIQTFKDGVLAMNYAVASVAPANDTFLFLGSRVAGLTTKQLAAGHMGGNLTDAEISTLYSALNTYLIAVGAA